MNVNIIYMIHELKNILLQTYEGAFMLTENWTISEWIAVLVYSGTILAINIEELSNKVRIMEDNQVSKWDVAIIVFTIIGGFAAFTAIVTFLLSSFN